MGICSFWRRSAAGFLALAGVSLAANTGHAQAPIRWKSQEGPTALSLSRMETAGIRDTLNALSGRHVVVQFDTPVTPTQRQELESAGLRLLRSVGSGGYFARWSGGEGRAQQIADVPELVQVAAIETQWKMHSLWDNEATPEWSLIDNSSPDPRVAAYVLFHRDVPLNRGRRLVERSGGDVIDVLESIAGMVIELPRSKIAELAGRDEVQWMEPPLPRMEGILVNDSNRTLTQVDTLHGAPFSLDGTGVSVMVYDGGTALSTHDDFSGRLTVRDSAGLSFHATHVAGTIGGDGTASGGTLSGMAPAVTIESYGFQFDGTGTFLYTNPGDIESDYDEAINVHGVDISNNSIGTNTEPNGFPCNYQGDYGVTSALIDAIVRGSLGNPFRIIWANGNERQGSNCDVEGFGDYYSTAPPAGAKNHIAVGALNSNNDTMTSFSSWGPTDDGRIKPDVSGPGCQSDADGGVTSTDSSGNTAYVTLCGTSMAAPTVTGICALLLEDYRANFVGADPRNSMLKAFLAHNAADTGNAGPDYQFGYGSVRAQDTIEFVRLGQFTEETLDNTGSRVAYTLSVAAATPELKVTMAWDDAPGTPNVLPALVNDLDLVVTDPNGGRHYPWTLDPLAPADPAVQTSEDHTNNIEQVQVASPMAGTWRVEIFGHDIPEGPQTFSICASEAMSSAASVNIALLDELPSTVEAGTAHPLMVETEALGDSIVPGSATLHFRYDGGDFLTASLPLISGSTYDSTLPPPVCGATMEYYWSVEGAVSGTVTLPVDAPASFFTTDVQTAVTVFQDDFENDLGWTIENIAVTDGAFERAIPAGGGGRADPLTDFDGSGHCYLTDNVAGNSDLDGGPSRITSPTIDLSGPGPYVVTYAAWFANNDFDIDRFDVEISNDDGSNFTLVDSFGNTNGWQVRSFTVSDFVTPTSQIRLRFSATDNPNDSVTEVAIDAILIERIECNQSLADCNGNMVVDSDDIASGRSPDIDSNGEPDECGGPRQKELPDRKQALFPN